MREMKRVFGLETEYGITVSGADVWIADDTKNVVRVALDLDVALPDAQVQSTGVQGVKLLLDATTVPRMPNSTAA